MINEKDNKKLVVLGIYKNTSAAAAGVDVFRLNGFRPEDISALLPYGDNTKEFAHEKSTKAPEGATTGGMTGVALGGTLGWLAGIGSLAIPGLGALVAAGPIMGLLAGAGVGGTVGALSGALVGLGFPEYEAKRYEGKVKDGGVLFSVHCDNSEWKDKAMKTFNDTGAIDISSTSESESDYKPNPMIIKAASPKVANY